MRNKKSLLFVCTVIVFFQVKTSNALVPLGLHTNKLATKLFTTTMYCHHIDWVNTGKQTSFKKIIQAAALALLATQPFYAQPPEKVEKTIVALIFALALF